jgi:hypothetical protein
MVTPVSSPACGGNSGMRIEATSIMACMNSATEVLEVQRRSVSPCPQCDLADTVLHEVPADRGEGGDVTPGTDLHKAGLSR